MCFYLLLFSSGVSEGLIVARRSEFTRVGNLWALQLCEAFRNLSARDKTASARPGISSQSSSRVYIYRGERRMIKRGERERVAIPSRFN